MEEITKTTESLIPDNRSAPGAQAIKGVALIEVLEEIKHRRSGIMVTMLGVVIATYFLLMLVPSKYRAEMVLAIGEREQSASALASSSSLNTLATLAGNGPVESSKNEAVAILQSRVLINEFVQENNLLPVLFSEDWDDETKAWKTKSLKDAPTLWDAYYLFDKKIRRVEVDKKTGLVIFTIDWIDPRIAMEWANGIVKKANAYLSAQAVMRANRHLMYLEEQLKKVTSVELQQVIYRLMENEFKNAMLASVTDEYAFKIIDPPVVPKEPFWPRRLLIAGGCGLAVLLMSFVFLIFVVNQRNQNSLSVS